MSAPADSPQGFLLTKALRLHNFIAMTYHGRAVKYQIYFKKTVFATKVLSFTSLNVHLCTLSKCIFMSRFLFCPIYKMKKHLSLQQKTKMKAAKLEFH